jgi:hypothetical protein
MRLGISMAFAYDAPPKPRVRGLDLSFSLAPISHGFQLGILGRQ